MIAAIALPLLALIFVVRMLFFGSPAPSAQKTSNANRRPTPQRTQPGQIPAPAESEDDLMGSMRQVVYDRFVYGGPDAGRNIFAFYVPPVRPTPDPNAVPPTPVQTPTPPPPLVLASLAPQSVYARTGNFTLQVSGDKFTPATRVYIEGQEQPTQFKSPQQLVATVPAATIAFPGARNIIVRTPDNQLYSNPSTLNVMQPPAPTYTYVGLLKRRRSDTAVLKDAKGELYSVRVGDIVEGRFRVTAITDRSVEVTDKDLNIKHPINFVEQRGVTVGAPPGRAPGSIQPPPPPPSTDDEEP